MMVLMHTQITTNDTSSTRDEDMQEMVHEQVGDHKYYISIDNREGEIN